MSGLRVLLRVAGAAVVALLCLGCGGSGGSPASRVRIAVQPFLSYGPVFIAADEGLFAAAGVDVEFVILSTNDAAAALANGDVDVVANFLSSGVFNGIRRGGRMALVADKGHEAADACVANGLMVRSSLVQEGRLPDLSSLRGRKLEVRLGGVEEYYVERLLRGAGLTLADMQVHKVPWNAKMEAFRAGAIDLAAWSEPNLTRAAEAGVGAVLAGAGEVMPGGQYATLMYGRSLLEDRRELGVRLMVAYLDAVRRYARGKTDRNVEVLARHTGLGEDLVRRACWIAIRPDGRVNVDSVVEFQQWAVGRGYQDAVVEPEVFWDPWFVEEAQRRLDARRGER